MSHIVGPGNHVTVSNQAAQHAVVRPQTIRTRIIMPPHAALAQVVEELVQNPLTDDELWVLSDMGTATDTLVVEKVEDQLEGTRILALLRILVAKTNITVPSQQQQCSVLPRKSRQQGRSRQSGTIPGCRRPPSARRHTVARSG